MSTTLKVNIGGTWKICGTTKNTSSSTSYSK